MLEALRGAITQAENELRQVQQERETLKANVELLEARCKRAVDNLVPVQAENARLKQRVAEAAKQIEFEQKRLTDANLRLTPLTKERDELKEAARRVASDRQAEREGFALERRKYEAAVEVQTKRAAELEQKVVLAQSRQSTEAKVQANVGATVDNLKRQVAQSEQVITDLRASLSKANVDGNNHVAALNRSLGECNVTNNRLKNEIQAARAEAAQRAAELLAKDKLMQDQRLTHQNVNDNLQQKLVTANAEIGNKNNLLARYEKELKAAVKKLTILQAGKKLTDDD